MIKKMLLAFTILLALASNAQTIHWLTFIDTTDPNVGAIDVNGRKVLYSRFIDKVNAAIMEKGYKSNIQDVYGTNLSPQKCKEMVSNLKVEPQDVVVFYYIGHGTHGTQGGDVWPMMFMGQDDPNMVIPLKWVHDQIKAKNPKLTATIGMCCNVYQQIKRSGTPSFSVNYGSSTLSDVEKSAIQDMFLGYKGDFLVTSASPGQSSLGGDTTFGPMDFFTCILVKVFEDYAYDGYLEWSDFFDTVKNSIHLGTEGQQTPLFAANVSKASIAPTAVPTPQPVEVNLDATATSSKASASSKQDLLNAIGEVLDNLIDMRQSEKARIAQASSLEKAFAPTAKIKVLGQDGDVVIDKSSAEDFIGRLATSRILLKVTPVDVTVYNRAITELKVKETYKK